MKIVDECENGVATVSRVGGGSVRNKGERAKKKNKNKIVGFNPRDDDDNIIRVQIVPTKFHQIPFVLILTCSQRRSDHIFSHT